MMSADSVCHDDTQTETRTNMSRSRIKREIREGIKAKKGRQTKETSYSWVILIAATSVSFFQLGLVKVFGVFIPELVEQLKMSSSAVGLCCGIGIGLRAILGPVWTALTRATSNRFMVVSGGFLGSLGIICVSFSRSPIHLGLSMTILSIGSGMPLVAKVNIVKEYFKTHFNLANSLAFAGGAIGMTVLAPLIELCIESFGWRGAMLVFGAMNCNISVAGALMRKARTNKLTETKKQINQENTTFLQSNEGFCGHFINLSKLLIHYLGFQVLFKYPTINFYLFAMTIHSLVNSGWVLFLVSYTISLGFSLKNASFLSAMGGGGALVGRILIGPFLQSGILSGHMTFFYLAVGSAGLVFCYPFVHIYWMLGLMSFLTGMLLGTTPPVFVAMMKEVVNDHSSDFAGAVGLQYMFRGTGMMVGGLLTGWLYDSTGNFYFSYITLAVMESFAAVLVILPSVCLRKCCNQEHKAMVGSEIYDEEIQEI